MDVSLDVLAEAFQALADPTRLRLLKVILSAPGAVCVCELVDALELPQYQVSRHLAQLKSGGWLQSERHGTWIYYKPVSELEPWRIRVLSALKYDDHLSDAVFQHDQRRLERRMALRRDGRCVIGYAVASAGAREEEE
jgi:ArsR family transcriptional regulator